MNKLPHSGLLHQFYFAKPGYVSANREWMSVRGKEGLEYLGDMKYMK